MFGIKDKLSKGSEEEEEIVKQYDISMFDAFKIAKNPRRMKAVEIIAREGAMELRDLAKEMARWENDEMDQHSEVRPESKEYKRVYVGLYQTHLPKMDSDGFVDYNQDRGIVQANECIHALNETIEFGSKRFTR